MTKAINKSHTTLSFQIEGVNIDFIKHDNRIRLRKKELASIFDTDKETIKQALFKSESKKLRVSGKLKKHYSIDTIIILGYKLKKYKETKMLVLLNRYFQTHNSSETLLSKVKQLYTRIEKYALV